MQTCYLFSLKNKHIKKISLDNTPYKYICSSSLAQNLERIGYTHGLKPPLTYICLEPTSVKFSAHNTTKIALAKVINDSLFFQLIISFESFYLLYVLKYGRHTILYWFQVYDIVIQQLYTS